jgi:tRNA (guanine-N7-)-methyltransferase
MRLRRKSGTKELLETLEQRVVLQPKAYKGRWREVFGNDKPIHAELGMGKGRFISLMSLQHPEWNFIGIDMYDELIRKGSEKADETREEWSAANGQEAPNNLRLVLGNIEGIEEMFAPGELERIYLNFSDPWPKTRHANRRLTHANFVTKYRDILNADGEIHFKTDSRSLFEFSLNSFAEMELMMRNISLDLHGNGTAPNNVMTEYERKFSSQGVNIHRVEVIVGDMAIIRRREELSTLRKRRAALEAAAENEGADTEASEELTPDARGRPIGAKVSVRGAE